MTAAESDERITALTTRLADLLADERGTSVLAALQKLATARGEDPSTGAPVAPPVGPPAEVRLGVWVHQPDGGWRRDPDIGAEARRWADVEHIPAGGGRPRIVLIGESVARGYFFDPALTPASLLADVLQTKGDEPVEVVDLARVGLTAAELRDLLATVDLLEPAAVVVHAGNNWELDSFSVAELDALAQAWRDGGVLVARQAMLQVLAGRAHAVVHAAAALAERAAVPVVLVIPACNLADWGPEPTLAVPVLPGDGTARWFERREALDGGSMDPPGAAAAALELLALDGGTSPWAGIALASALLELGHLADARPAFELARDGNAGLLAPRAPRCPGLVAEILRHAAGSPGLHVVDLPAAFETATPGGVVGHRWFLDYCHHTLDGLHLAIGEIAEAVAGATDWRVVPRRPPVGEAAEAERRTVARASFLAAVHSAHYGQPAATVERLARSAVAAWEPIGDRIERYVEASTATTELVWSKAWHELCQEPAVARYLEETSARLVDRLLDEPLHDGLLAALDGVGRSAFRDAHHARLVTLHRPVHGVVDLLAPRHHSNTFVERWGGSFAVQRVAWHQCLVRRSRFVWWDDDPRPLRLRATLRACEPAGAEPGAPPAVDVQLNGRSVAPLDVEGRWRTVTVALPADLWRHGRNELELRWPAVAPDGDRWSDRASRDLEAGRFPALYPVFGELHELLLEELR